MSAVVNTDSETKLCPHCAKQISAMAIRCRYCHSDLRASDGGTEKSQTFRDGEFVLDKYRINSELGRGELGVVYLAVDQELMTPVALKVLPGRFAGDPVFVEEYRKRARAAAGLQHEHIMPVLEVGYARGFHYMAMSFVQGQTLARRLADGPMRAPRAVDIVRKLALALDYAHSRNVLHLNIKPGNIFLRAADGEPLIADFGLAHALRVSRVAGGWTGDPEYMSPELIVRGEACPGSDIYSLGAVLYEMLAGEPPFTGDPQSVRNAHLQEMPPSLRERNPAVSVNLGLAVNRMLKKLPKFRFQSGKEIAAVLEPEIPPTEQKISIPLIHPPLKSVFNPVLPVIDHPTAASKKPVGDVPVSSFESGREQITLPPELTAPNIPPVEQPVVARQAPQPYSVDLPVQKQQTKKDNQQPVPAGNYEHGTQPMAQNEQTMEHSAQNAAALKPPTEKEKTGTMDPADWLAEEGDELLSHNDMEAMPQAPPEMPPESSNMTVQIDYEEDIEPERVNNRRGILVIMTIIIGFLGLAALVFGLALYHHRNTSDTDGDKLDWLPVPRKLAPSNKPVQNQKRLTEADLGGDGGTLIVVPNVLKMDVEKAKEKIGPDFVIEIKYVSDESAKSGSVLKQTPGPEEKARKNDVVILFVSRGPPEPEDPVDDGTSMPNFVGKTLREAKASLLSLGFKHNIVFTENTGKPAQTVVKQSINPGAKLETIKDKSIDLYVAAPSEENSVDITPEPGQPEIPANPVDSENSSVPSPENPEDRFTVIR